MSDFKQSDKWCLWKAGSALAKKAAELVGETRDDTVRSVYRFVRDNVTYDKAKADELRGKRGYVPDPDSTFESMSGICFDYASLMCAMLRSQGISAKLCVGYRNEQTHAWVEAPVGGEYRLFDPTFGSKRKGAVYKTAYEL